MTVSLTVNGARRTSAAAPDVLPLYVLRNNLGLNSAKLAAAWPSVATASPE